MDNMENENNSQHGKDEIQNPAELPEELKNVIDKLPDTDRKAVTSSFSMFMQGMTRPRNPMMEKITSEHISLSLTYSEAESKRIFELQKREKTLDFWLVIIVLGFIFALCYMFKNNIEHVKQIIMLLVTFIGGYGFALKKITDK